MPSSAPPNTSDEKHLHVDQTPSTQGITTAFESAADSNVEKANAENETEKDAATTLEQKALHYTLWGNLVITLLGVGFAIWTRSEAIFLDGLFSGIHLIISLLSLWIAQIIQRPSDEDYPFGYAMLEPFLNLGKGLVIVMVALFAIFSAGEALLNGGRSVDAGIALWYALLAAAGCLAMAAMQWRFAQQSHSQILELDFKNWLMDGAISSAVAIAFAIMLLLQGTAWQHWIPYADPMLVLMLVLLVLPLPLQTVIRNSLQIVGKAPDGEQRTQVEDIVAGLLQELPHQAYHVRQMNIGRLRYVQVYLCVSLGQEARYEAGAVDGVRSRLYERLHEVFPHLAMDLVVTCDQVWVQRAVMPGG